MPVTDVNPYVIQFKRFNDLRTAGPAWLRAIREHAFARFTTLGFPTARQEEWRFTNVSPIAERAFQVAVAGAGVRGGQVAPFGLAAADAVEIVFVNGRFAPGLSTLQALPPGVSVRSLADVLTADSERVAAHLARHAAFDNEPFAALNTAFASDGAVVEASPNAVVTRPIHILFVAASGGEVSYPRVLVRAGRNSQMQLVESHIAPDGSPTRLGHPGAPSFTNAVSEIVLDDGAVVDYYRVQREATDSFHVSTTQVTLSHSSTFSSHTFSFGGAIVRNDINALLAGEGGDCTLNGLYLAGGTQLVDNHTVIDHAQPHCGSHEVYKGILGGRARAVFNGKILVRPDAQKTDAKQTNKNLVLSEDATINTKPQLEIFADDVKCTHGATVGQLDAESMFYLRSRGIDAGQARAMLIDAFAHEVIDGIKEQKFREYVGQLV
ncbi:MAG: Fe-S cluster assembly protein SufD [Acidobacteriia bacterium]|nr:Fe-S cluster assembly protein SufD [Terriglobia bacterium]